MHSHAVRAMLAAAKSGVIDGLIQGPPAVACAHGADPTARVRMYVNELGEFESVTCCAACLFGALKFSTSREYRQTQVG